MSLSSSSVTFYFHFLREHNLIEGEVWRQILGPLHPPLCCFIIKKGKLKQSETLFLGTRRVTEAVSGTGRRQLTPGVILAHGGNMRRNHTEGPDMEGKKSQNNSSQKIELHFCGIYK